MVFGGGINGEFVAVDYTVSPESPVLDSRTTGPAFAQSRTLKWVGRNSTCSGRRTDGGGSILLLVANRDMLFYNASSASASSKPVLVQNLSFAAANLTNLAVGAAATVTAAAAAWPAVAVAVVAAATKPDGGINGVVEVTSPAGQTMLVGATMHRMTLVAARLVAAGGGTRATEWARFGVYGLDSPAYDIDAVSTPSGPMLVTVGPAEGNEAAFPVLRTYNVTDPGTGLFRDKWQAAGVAKRSWPNAKGCNRVRVHQRSRRAVFSCFGGDDLVGFVDLRDASRPSITGTTAYISEQPTGMLVVGDAVIVAGGRDMMVFDMRVRTIRGGTTPTRYQMRCGSLHRNTWLMTSTFFFG